MSDSPVLFTGDGAAKIFERMWFFGFIERGVDAESLPKMSLLPPPKETHTHNDPVSPVNQLTVLVQIIIIIPGGLRTLRRKEEKKKLEFASRFVGKGKQTKIVKGKLEEGRGEQIEINFPR